jgi:UDP-glucose 4-epimerase
MCGYADKRTYLTGGIPDMKALVTGGAGFIGSHLVRGLVKRGHQVHVIDDLSTGRAGRIHPDAVLHVADIRSPAAGKIIAEAKPDIVYHLAAQADVQHSIKEPYTDADVNITGTTQVLEACRLTGVSKLVFASTSAVYGDLQKERIEERDPAQPISFYGMSKWTAERYIALYSQLYSLPYTILRYGNVYGPGQTAKGEGGVIALFMERLKKGEPLLVHGDGEQTRDFIYVQDVVMANLAAMEHGNGHTLHVSTERRTSVNQIVELLQELHGGRAQTHYGPARPGDIKHSCLSNQLGTAVLRWQPEQDIRAGIGATYRYWFQE